MRITIAVVLVPWKSLSWVNAPSTGASASQWMDGKIMWMPFKEGLKANYNGEEVIVKLPAVPQSEVMKR